MDEVLAVCLSQYSTLVLKMQVYGLEIRSLFFALRRRSGVAISWRILPRSVSDRTEPAGRGSMCCQTNAAGRRGPYFAPGKRACHLRYEAARPQTVIPSRFLAGWARTEPSWEHPHRRCPRRAGEQGSRGVGLSHLQRTIHRPRRASFAGSRQSVQTEAFSCLRTHFQEQHHARSGGSRVVRLLPWSAACWSGRDGNAGGVLKPAAEGKGRAEFADFHYLPSLFKTRL